MTRNLTNDEIKISQMIDDITDGSPICNIEHESFKHLVANEKIADRLKNPDYTNFLVGVIVCETKGTVNPEILVNVLKQYFGSILEDE